LSNLCRVILADPPWKLGDKLPGKSRGAEKNYEVMSVGDIMRFPLPETEPDAWLFMWRLSSMVPEAYEVVKAWGFEHKSEIVWDKLTRTGKPWFGMGRYVRAAHETCIIAVKGHPKPLSRSVRSRFEAQVGRHSEKPHVFYEIIESLSEGPYTELFARNTREGWDSYGLELERPHP
jgi:site-specific DNA-methyltransferase (adenine-specific)